MSDFLSRLKGIFQVLSGNTPLQRRGALRFQGVGVRVEDGGDATNVTFPAGLQADAVGGGRTAGAQTILIARLAVPTNAALRVQVDVQGQSSSNATIGFGTSTHVSARRPGSGTVQAGGIDEVSSDISAPLAGVVVALQGAGGDLQVWITGVAGQTVDWSARIRVLSGPYVSEFSAAGMAPYPTAVVNTVQVNAGDGLVGGGALSGDVTLNVAALDSTVDVQPNGIRVGNLLAPITQADFYLDWAAGSDSNDGSDSAHALRTVERLSQILARGAVSGNYGTGTVTVHVLSDSDEARVELYVRCIYGGRLLVVDDRAVADRAIASYPITARTNWNDAARTEVSFTCSGIPTTIAALPSTDGVGGVGYQAIISASATPSHVGASTWVVAETSARTALGPGWYHADNFGLVDPSVGDTVAFCRMRKFTGYVQVSVEGHGRVEFRDLELGMAEQAFEVLAACGTVYFTRCLVHGFNAGSDIYATGVATAIYLGSRGHNGCRAISGSSVSCLASCFTRSIASAINVYGIFAFFEQNLVYNAAIVLSGRCQFYVYGGCSVALYGANASLSAGEFSTTAICGVMWGRNVSTVFINMYPFAQGGAVAGGLALVGTTPAVAIQKFTTGPSQATLTLPFNASGNTSFEVL